MNVVFRSFSAIPAMALALLAGGCSGGSQFHPTPAQTYSLTVNSSHPSSGVSISASPADQSNTSQGTTGFTLRYLAGASVTLTAPATAGGMFGDTALDSSSAEQGKLAVYGAVRASDGAVTVMVINKTYGALTSTITLDHFTSSSATAQVFEYSNANLASIATQPPAAVTPPAAGGTASTISTTFPAQSITLLVLPK